MHIIPIRKDKQEPRKDKQEPRREKQEPRREKQEPRREKQEPRREKQEPRKEKQEPRKDSGSCDHHCENQLCHAKVNGATTGAHVVITSSGLKLISSAWYRLLDAKLLSKWSMASSRLRDACGSNARSGIKVLRLP